MYRVFAYKGYFVGAYAQRVGEASHQGCAAICSERPDSAESARALEKVYSIGTYPEEERAIHAAEHQARQIIDGLGLNWDPFTAPGTLNSR